MLMLASFGSRAQDFEYGNNWYRVNPNRTFIKLVVEEDGIYRLSGQALQQAGYDLSGVDLRYLRLFYRGKEVPMYVSGSGGSLQYLEFFGRRNDGRVDSIMYRNPLSGLHEPGLQPNKNISLFSDESAYFLTWDNIPGKRYINVFDPTYSLYTPESHFTYEARLEFHPDGGETEYVRGGGGAFDPPYSLNCDYVTGEGYVGPSFSYGQNKSRVINIPTPAAANFQNRPVVIRARVFGRSNTQHRLRIEMDGNSQNPVLDTTWNANLIYLKTYVREHLAQLDKLTDLRFIALNEFNNRTDNNNICWASVTYDRLFDMDSARSIRVTNWDKAVDAYFRFEGADGNDSVFVYDLQNPIRAKGIITNGQAHVIVPGFGGKRDLFVATDKGIKTPRIEKAALNRLHDPANGAEYVIITHRLLQPSAEAYAHYRDTATVTPLDGVRIVYTDEIYDEYGYGTITPWAIKRFCKDALDNWSKKPRYFLLWGKGNFLLRNAVENVVPTFGYPATDYEYVSHFDQYSVAIKPEAAIGRVNLFDNEDGFNYLEKVNEYEHTPWEPWMKTGVFLGGGGNPSEQQSIRNAFEFFIGQFGDVPYGGIPVYFQKTSSSTQDQRNSAPYHDAISAGTSLIHFFGHSTANIQDVTLKEPFEYTNNGRYPFMIAMGCYGGDFTPNIKTFGEQWVGQKGKGSIGYLGGSSAGYLSPLKTYGQVFYKNLYHRLMGLPVGEAIRQTMDVYTDSLSSIQYRNHGRQMNLQGDPAIRLYHAQKPDLEVNQTSVIFTPENFSAQEDSIIMQVILRNLALAVNDSVKLIIQQHLPEGEVLTHFSQRIAAPRNVDTLSLVIYNELGNAITGQNEFTVFIDADEELDEYSESNNRTTISRIVPGNIPAILFPTEFAVVDEPNIHLDASAFFITQNANVGYVFEIDTTDQFNSPMHTASGVVQGTSTYASWNVPFSLQENQVYYWRVRLSEVTPSIWGTSSFKYIPGKTGWAQSKIPQIKKDETHQVTANQIQHAWEFDKFKATYSFATGRGRSFEYSLNGALQTNANLNGFFSDGIAFLELDQFSLEPVYNYDRLYTTFLRLVKSPAELHVVKNAILNAQHGNYFIIGSTANPHIPQWGDELFEALELIGASQNIRLLQDGDAFLILGRKGYPGSAIEVLAPNVESKYVIELDLKAAFEQGTIRSTKIGPALSWQQMYWDWRAEDAFAQESVTVKAYAERNDGTDSLLFTTRSTDAMDLSNLDADRFPFMRLEALVKD
ncbi:MAG: hypothetical protein D6730_13340, partial [Bacteroidetes bacterium]